MRSVIIEFVRSGAELASTQVWFLIEILACGKELFFLFIWLFSPKNSFLDK